MSERYSLSANSIAVLFNYLRSLPYESVRPIFDMFDKDLEKFTVENIDITEEPKKKVTRINKRSK
jgi:hypothetical protein